MNDLGLIQIPLILRGVSDNFLNTNSFFSNKIFLPVEFSGEGDWDKTAEYKPGTAIAVQLITGDWNVSGIGTITAITEDGKILAFGHPCFGFGKTLLPAATAGIHAIMKNTSISWKIGSPIKTRGAMIQDRMSSIIIDPEISCNFIKTKLSYILPDSKTPVVYNLGIANNKFLTSRLISAALNYSGNVTLNVAGPKLTYIHKFSIIFNEKSILEYSAIDYTQSGGSPVYNIVDHIVSQLMNNNFQDVTINEFDYNCRIINANLKYKISGVVPSVREAEPGDTVILTVRLTHHNLPDKYISIPVYIDESLKTEESLVLHCSGGENIPVFKPDPLDFRSYVENLKQDFSAADIVVFYKTGYSKYLDAGSIIAGGPALTDQKLFENNPMKNKIPELIYSKFPQEFIIDGKTQITIKIK